MFDCLYALSLPSAPSTRTATAAWLADLAPMDVWAAIWAVVGAVLIIGAFHTSDRVAFAAAALLKIMWAAVYMVGWIWHDVGHAWVAALVWSMTAAIVLVISTWPEHPWPPPCAGER